MSRFTDDVGGALFAFVGIVIVVLLIVGYGLYKLFF